MEKHYELHSGLKSNKLCPFKLARGEFSDTSFYNWHENIEIILVTSEEGGLSYSADELRLREGDMVVINSGVIHRPCAGLEFFYLIIDEEFCRENGISVREVEFERSFRDGESKALFIDVRRAMEEYSKGETIVADVRCAVLKLLLHLYSHHRDISSGGALSTVSEDSVKRALAIINGSYTDGLTLEGIAAECGVTKYHLAREFKKQTGLTVVTYINALRCKHAARSIADGSSISSAAIESGFESLSYFSRMYKRMMGTAPSAVKRKLN